MINGDKGKGRINGKRKGRENRSREEGTISKRKSITGIPEKAEAEQKQTVKMN